MDSRILRIWLSQKNVISRAKAALLEDYLGSIEAVYEADPSAYAGIKEISRTCAMALCDKSLAEAEKIISDCEKLGIRILTCDDSDFPASLSTLSSPVQVLYTLGTVPDWDDMLGIAVVGTRRNTEYGQVAAERISRELAEKGITIISGMAAGIDSFALKSALRIGAPTVAVMGCGLDSAYPPENRRLMDSIIKTGCAMSEYPPFSPPLKSHFPERNRIVCGLSDGVLAVEAPYRSGTLITTRYAKESGRTIFAVPGNIFAANSKGTNMLIKQGAVATTCAADILDEFPIRAARLKPFEKKEVPPKPVKEEKKTAPQFDGLDDDSRKIAELLVEKDMHIEEIAARADMTIAELNGILPLLEIDGIIRKLAGNIYKYNTEG